MLFVGCRDFFSVNWSGRNSASSIKCTCRERENFFFFFFHRLSIFFLALTAKHQHSASPFGGRYHYYLQNKQRTVSMCGSSSQASSTLAAAPPKANSFTAMRKKLPPPARHWRNWVVPVVSGYVGYSLAWLWSISAKSIVVVAKVYYATGFLWRFQGEIFPFFIYRWKS